MHRVYSVPNEPRQLCQPKRRARSLLRHHIPRSPSLGVCSVPVAQLCQCHMLLGYSIFVFCALTMGFGMAGPVGMSRVPFSRCSVCGTGAGDAETKDPEDTADAPERARVRESERERGRASARARERERGRNGGGGGRERTRAARGRRAAASGLTGFSNMRLGHSLPPFALQQRDMNSRPTWRFAHHFVRGQSSAPEVGHEYMVCCCMQLNPIGRTALYAPVERGRPNHYGLHTNRHLVLAPPDRRRATCAGTPICPASSPSRPWGVRFNLSIPPPEPLTPPPFENKALLRTTRRVASAIFG